MLERLNPWVVFGVMGAALLGLAWWLHIPMMLWDHLDLVPLLQAAGSGGLATGQLLEVHGGHNHASAYAVLLKTTTLSGGWPMADVLVSWVLLLAFAALVTLCARGVQTQPSRSSLLTLVVLLCLSTLHLPNLIWGWQVAVFICLLGVGISAAAVVLEMPWAARLALGALGIFLSLSSFATGAALYPALLIAVLLRDRLTAGDKLELGLLWGLWCGFLLYWMEYLPATQGPALDFPALVDMAVYALNYLGGGAIRFATDLGLPVALAGIVLLWLALRRLWPNAPNAAALWCLLAVFAIGAAVLTAYGRAPYFGAKHAFVLRYGSFASLFWLAVVGAVVMAHQLGETRTWRYGLRTLAVLLVINSLHFIPQARGIHKDAAVLRDRVVETWPAVPDEVLREIYFDDADEARARLQFLHDKAYPPFE